MLGGKFTIFGSLGINFHCEFELCSRLSGVMRSRVEATTGLGKDLANHLTTTDRMRPIERIANLGLRRIAQAMKNRRG